MQAVRLEIGKIYSFQKKLCAGEMRGFLNPPENKNIYSVTDGIGVTALQL